MRRTLGLLLMLIGGLVMLAGIGLALKELASLYGGVLSDPLGQPEGVEKQTSRAMIQYVILGAAGVPVFLVGTFLLKKSVIQRLHRGK